MNTHVEGPQAAKSRAAALTKADRLKNEVESLRSRLAKLNEASLGIFGSLDADAVLQAVIDASRLLTDARYGAILTFDDSGEMEHFFTSGISPEERRRIGRMPQGLGILGYMNEIEGPLRLTDIAGHPRSIGFPENHPPMKSFLGIPIRRDGKHLGNIYLAEKEGGGDFTPEDEESLATFAAQGAAAIANSRIYRAENRARADLEALLDISPVAVLVWDAKTWDLLSLNAEARRIVYGQHMPGHGLKDLLRVMTLRRPNGQDIPPEELSIKWTALTGQTVRAEEVVIHLPDGKVIPALHSTAPIRKEDGEIVGVVATLQDMTPLEDLAKQQAEFLTMVSHDLRNPLVSIKGSVTTLLGSSSSLDSADMRQFLRIIDQQADRMSGLLSNLLDMGRIETGTVAVDTGPADLTALMEEARRAFLTTGARNIIGVDITQRLPLVMADRQRIKQVLINLLSNASRHSPDWSEITVSASVEGLQAIVAVADKGAGIAPDRLPHIFRKYSQFDADQPDRSGTGDGLNLAICRGIVEAHGGRIWAESDGLGLGATFTFTIPVADGDTVHASPSPETGTAPSDARERASAPARVLAIDDDTQTLRFIRGALLEAGYTPLVTTDPDEAVHLAKTEKPDLLLLDFTLHGADGIDVMRRVLEVTDVPVILLPEHDEEDLITEAFESGADDYIVKPFSPGELAGRIKATLRKRGAQARTRSAKPFVLGDLAVDHLAGSVTLAGREIRLTPTEYKLLHEFSMNPGRVLTYDHLLRRVWDSDYSSDTQVVRTFVKNLRSKLGDKADSPTYILTVPAIGYRMPKP
ncbi:MAG: winged helix-turn-helix domain-containing protein [Chloroflexota bacterium]|nr:winged helix-turn-helix domain-containing protein [Chloroflexota bacterium]MDE2969574.1 winged helix-turn-helix domain-containing protein [Chloroflexota bacterium]